MTVLRVIGRLLLIIAYYVVVTPIALIRRLVAGNPMRHEVGDMGYWHARAPETADAADMQKPS